MLLIENITAVFNHLIVENKMIFHLSGDLYSMLRGCYIIMIIVRKIDNHHVENNDLNHDLNRYEIHRSSRTKQ